MELNIGMDGGGPPRGDMLAKIGDGGGVPCCIGGSAARVLKGFSISWYCDWIGKLPSHTVS
jgi:hypothetical protein